MVSDRYFTLNDAYQFAAEHGLTEQADDILDMRVEWSRTPKSRVRRSYFVRLLEENGLFEPFKERFWVFGNSEEGNQITEAYRTLLPKYQEYLVDLDDFREPDINTVQQFAYESDLRDFLARNLSVIEPDLKLYQDEERNGVEYPVDNGRGRIDILARDNTGKFVVIELKVSRGRNQTIGQILYYMGWVDNHLSTSAKCRGIIVAKEIADDLTLACERVSGVSLYKYNLSVSVEKMFGE